MMGMRFTEVSETLASTGNDSLLLSLLGAIRFDRDVRAIANYLSSQTSFGGARDKFVRLQQIGTVLNMDAVRSIPTSCSMLMMWFRTKIRGSSTRIRGSHGGSARRSTTQSRNNGIDVASE